MATTPKRWALLGVLLALLAAGALAWPPGALAQAGGNLINGFVFNDLGPDDLVGPGDVPIPGVTITLRDVNGATVTSTVTDASGEFSFLNVLRGTYLVTETDPAGLGSIDAMPGTAGVSVDLNTVRITMGEGLTTYAGTVFLDRQMTVPPAGQNLIRGSVFDDADGNGDIDVGEPPLGGVLVTLRDANGTAIGNRYTSNFGEFAFSGLADGAYTLEETDPAGVTSSAALAGTGGQVLTPNTIRVTTVPGTLRYAGHAFLDRAAQAPSPPPVTPPPATGLSLQKTVDRASAAPGDLLTYTLFVTNVGAAATDRASLFDLLPPGTAFVDATNGGALAGDTVYWNFASLAANTGGIASFRVRVLPNVVAGTVISNQAQAAVPAKGIVVSSNVVTTTIAAPGATLTLAKSVDLPAAQPGDVVTYTLTVANVGATPARGIILLDLLPAGLVFVDASTNVQVDPANRSLQFAPGDLAPGAVGAVSFRARVDASVPNGSIISNTAQITAANLGASVSSNTAVFTVQSASFVGTFKLIVNAASPTSLTVDPRNHFTVTTIPSGGRTPSVGAQGTLNSDGSFDVTTGDGQARFTGRVDPASASAAVTVQRSNGSTYSLVLPRAPDFNPLPPALVGTFRGFATNPAGDWLRVRMSIDPLGNATFEGDLIQFFPGQLRWRSGAYQVTPDGQLGFGGQVDGQLQVTGNNSLLLVYTFDGGDGYRYTFQVPLARL